MKLESIINKVETIEKKENERIKETRQQISELKERLNDTEARLDETYSSGDFEEGEKLSVEKTYLEAKINYLESFIEKKRAVPSIPGSSAMRSILSRMDLMPTTLLKDLNGTSV